MAAMRWIHGKYGLPALGLVALERGKGNEVARFKDARRCN